MKLLFGSLVVGLLAAAGMTGTAAASDDVTLSVVIKDHVFKPRIIKVPAGKRVELTVENRDATPEEFDSSALKVEKVILGHASGKVSFGPLEAGQYRFMGEFNSSTANGLVLAE